MNPIRSLRRARIVTCAGVLLAVLPALAAAQAPANRTLAAGCANCHGSFGRSPGAMPWLAGLPRKRLSAELRALRDGRRDATLMHQLAKAYTDAEIDALAEHFARLPQP